jgi:uncharacterized protein YdiU (UPF0061 family)
MSEKLGLTNEKASQLLIDELLEVMHFCGTHFTNFFRIIDDHSKQNWDL